MDCLSLLRKFISQGKKVSYVDKQNNPIEKIQDAHEFVFDQEARFPRDVLTTYPNRQSKTPYSLAALLFLLQNQDLDYSVYLKASMAAGVTSVSFLDRKPLLKFLHEAITSEPITSSPAIKRSRIEENESTENIEAALFKTNLIEVEPEMLSLINSVYHVYSPYQNFHASVNFTPGIDAMIKKRILDPPKKIATFSETHGLPVIVVPQNITACITKYNAKKFLEGNLYEDSIALTDQGLAKPHKLIVSRHAFDKVQKQSTYSIPNGVPTEYEVIDDIFGMTDDQLKRVVAIFSNGKPWQFRGFKWENPKEVFTNIPGFILFNPAEEGFNSKNLEGWKLRPYNISKHNQKYHHQYLDNFWRVVDKHIIDNMSWYNNPVDYWDKPASK